MGEHVELGERPGARVEPLAQQREERRIDVHGLFRRAVERTGRVGGRAAAGRGLDVDDDQLRLAVAVDGDRPVLVEVEGCRSEPAVVARIRVGTQLAVLDLLVLAPATGASTAEQTREVAPGEEIEQEDGDHAESGGTAADRDAAATSPRGVSPDLCVVVERHGFTVPRGIRRPPKMPDPLRNRPE